MSQPESEHHRFTCNGQEVILVDFEAAWVDSKKYAEVEYADGRRELQPWSAINVEKWYS